MSKYKLIVTGVRKNKVSASAHWWFQEKNTCRVTQRGDNVVATIEGKDKTVNKFVKHLLNKKNAQRVEIELLNA